MKVKIDARGKQCPLPVIEARKAVMSLHQQGEVEILVDNEIAVQNISKMASSQKLDFHSEKISTDQYQVVIVVKKSDGILKDRFNEGENKTKEQETGSQESCLADQRREGMVVVLSSNQMGSGEEALGKILMKGYIFALTQQDVLPQTILLYNSGAYLSVEGSESLEDLKSLEAQGVEILTCGTCLNHYQIADQLAAGEVTNMYVIAQKMAEADKLIRP